MDQSFTKPEDRNYRMRKFFIILPAIFLFISFGFAQHSGGSEDITGSHTEKPETVRPGEEEQSEGVTGEVIMHHLSDDRTFDIFNPFHPLEPIKIELYKEGGKPFLGITKQVVMMWISGLLLVLFFTLGYKKNRRVQSGFGNLLEVFIVFIRDEVVYPNMGKKQGDKFLPLILTFFFFIAVTNLLGIIPGSATATGSINVTAGLAIITFVTYVIFGNKHFWKDIFATPGVPLWLLPIMVPAEIFGLFTKPFALAIRLFANMNAGHIIIFAFLGIIINLKNYWIAVGSVPMAIAINMLELFVAFLQAYIFALLSAIFIGMAVAEHDEH